MLRVTQSGAGACRALRSQALIVQLGHHYSKSTMQTHGGKCRAGKHAAELRKAERGGDVELSKTDDAETRNRAAEAKRNKKRYPATTCRAGI